MPGNSSSVFASAEFTSMGVGAGAEVCDLLDDFVLFFVEVWAINAPEPPPVINNAVIKIARLRWTSDLQFWFI